MKPMTRSQKHHASRVAALGCIACINNGYEDTPCEIHHVYSKVNGTMRSHDSIIGLCPQHHRHGGYGVAVHAGKAAFEDNHGTEAELLAQVQEMLGVS